MNLDLDEIYKRPILPCEQMYLDLPIGIRYLLLIALLRRKGLSINNWLPYCYEANRIYNTLIIRQQDAEELEKLGDYESANKLYEMNINDFYLKNEPYTKLKNSYVAKNQISMARNVCEKFLKMVETIRMIDKTFENHEFSLWINKFQEEIAKLQLD